MIRLNCNPVKGEPRRVHAEWTVGIEAPCTSVTMDCRRLARCPMTDISDDAPLRLKDAVKIAFPAGGMTVSGLRREHANGRLDVEVIAGKQFVTLRAIREMRERCKVAAPRNVKLPLGCDGTPYPPTGSARDLANAKIRQLRTPTTSSSDVLQARIRMRQETLKKERREQKRRDGGGVLRRD